MTTRIVYKDDSTGEDFEGPAYEVSVRDKLGVTTAYYHFQRHSTVIAHLEECEDAYEIIIRRINTR